MVATPPPRPTDTRAPDGKDEAALMARNGITRVPADHYHVDGYRYTNLADALAQVRRGAGKRAEG